MGQRSFPWDSTNADRLYTSEDFARMYRVLSDTGVLFGTDNELEVREAVPQAMRIRVRTGAAMLEGKFYQLYDEEMELNIDNADTNARIDRVVIQLDRNNRLIRLYLKGGDPASNPVPPALTRDESFYEISLAQIRVDEDMLKITNEDIIDERTDSDICGVANQAGSLSILGEDANDIHARMRGDLLMNESELSEVLAFLFYDRNQDGKVKIIRPDTAEQELEFFYIEESKLEGVDIADLAINTPGDTSPDPDRPIVFFTMTGPDDVNDYAGAQFNRWQGYSNPHEILFGTHGHYFSTFDYGTRIAYDGSRYFRIFSNDFRCYFDGTAAHIFRSDGSKVGGSIKIDKTVWGMSPTDSPRSLISDQWEDVDVSGERRIRLDDRLAASLHNYGVWLSNPDIKVKSKADKSFVIEGSGRTDIRLKGIRYDIKDQYFVDNRREMAGERGRKA